MSERLDADYLGLTILSKSWSHKLSSLLWLVDSLFLIAPTTVTIIIMIRASTATAMPPCWWREKEVRVPTALWLKVVMSAEERNSVCIV